MLVDGKKQRLTFLPSTFLKMGEVQGKHVLTGMDLLEYRPSSSTGLAGGDGIQI